MCNFLIDNHEGLILPPHLCVTRPDRDILLQSISWSNSTLQWRHNGCDGVSNHHPDGCLLNRLFRRRSKITSKLCVTGLCAGNSPVTGEFPAQMASDAEMFSLDDVIMTCQCAQHANGKVRLFVRPGINTDTSQAACILRVLSFRKWPP